MHFISGLPRSGSTLLAAIQRQNRALHAGMSSPVAALVMAMQRQMSQEAEGAPFIDDEIYGFLGLPPFAHDFETVAYEADEFDRRLGTPGLHRVGRRVAAVERETILPPGLFASFSGDAFWHDGPNPRGVRVV